MSHSYKTEIAWLIEVRLPTRWWTGEQLNPNTRWTSDPNKVIRFSRREDAERVIKSTKFMRQAGAFATQHSWQE